MTERLHIALIDDHPLFREGVAHVLTEHQGFEIVAEGGSADDAVRIAESKLPDIILLDVSMPGDWLQAVETIAAKFPVITIIILTVSENADHVSAALKAGAQGYLLKGIGGNELCNTIITIHRGETYVSPSLAAKLLSDFRSSPSRGPSPTDDYDELTYREEQILNLLAQGLSNKEIGARLELSEKTVKHYMTNILQKLRVRNRVEAALKAQKRSARPDRNR